jgi:1-acyl-sn-glycerol-3-phosphate acyltransferase
MLYFILRPLTRIALKAYFRRITINGIENLPKDKPLLICSNHPTGFIEPCLMACFLPRVLHFLVRGDLFERPVLKHILISTNQIPIYRFRDGYEKLRNNRDVMNLSYDKLAGGEAILIFPEASATETKYLRPIKKGAARMALETLKLHPETDLAVIPIGIDYSSPNRWRSFVNINIGVPIIPKLPKEESDIPKEILHLTRQINKDLGELLLVKNEEVDNKKLNSALDISQWIKPVKSSIKAEYDEKERHQLSREISANVSKSTDLSFLDRVGDKAYLMKKNGVNWKEILLSVLLIIPVSFLLAINAVPVLGGVAIRNKYVTENEFIASIALAASLGLYIILFTIVLVLSAVYYSWWSMLLFLFPIGGLVGLAGMDYIRQQYFNMRLKTKLGKEDFDEIYKKGEVVMEELLQSSK